MSHNVKVAGVIFDDIDTLETAFKNLQREGAIDHCAIFTRTPFAMRGWNGRTENVDMGIKLPNEAYDVGFRHTAEGFQPYFEHGFAPRGIAADRGSQDINGNTCSLYDGPAVVGKLSQEYRLLQLERNANREGLMTRRVSKEKGKIALEVIHR
jgi:hypothetical protein